MKFSRIDIPRKITPCPILEAIFELRFETDIPAEIIPGILYSEIKSEFPVVKSLPTLEIPQFIRESDPNLVFTPHQEFIGQNYNFRVGPRAVSLVCPKEYVGWTNFDQTIEYVIKAILNVQLMKKLTRIGLRYISVFEKENVFENLKIKYSIDGNSLINQKNQLRCEFNFSDFICVLQISNQHQNSSGEVCSIFDIDVILNLAGDEVPDLKEIKGFVSNSHEIEKRIFFSLIKDNYLQSLNPEY